MDERSVFPILYGLAARAPTLTRLELVRRIVTSLANYYGGPTCAIYTADSDWAPVAAEPSPSVANLGDADRERLDAIERQLVRRTLERGKMATGLDLGGADVFLEEALGVADLFGFPLAEEPGGPVSAVAVLSLGEHSPPFRDPDMYALSSLGALLALAGRAIEPE